MLTVFVLWELHTDEPMLDMRYFRNPASARAAARMMLVFLAMYGVMFLMTQYFQLVLGLLGPRAALRLLPMAPIMLVVDAAHPADRARFGAQPGRSAFGMVLIAVGFLLFTQLDLHTPFWYVLAVPSSRS